MCLSLQGLQFIPAVFCLLDGRQYRSNINYDKEFIKWIKFLLSLLDYDDRSAPECIKLFTDPLSKVFQYFGTKFIISRVSI